MTWVASAPLPMVKSDAVAWPASSLMCPVVVAIRPPASIVMAAEVTVPRAVCSESDNECAAALFPLEPAVFDVLGCFLPDEEQAAVRTSTKLTDATVTRWRIMRTTYLAPGYGDRERRLYAPLIGR